MAETLPKRTSRGLSPFFSRDPLLSLREEMDDVMSRFFSGWDSGRLSQDFVPSLDIAETDNALEVRMDVPGIKPEQLNIEVSGNSLRISGDRKEEREEKQKAYHRVERRFGSFSRSVTLPCSVQDDEVNAEYQDGILVVTLPKTEQAKTHKVKVKAK